MGRVRTLSTMDCQGSFHFPTFWAKKIPKKKQITVVMQAVFRDIHKGLQSNDRSPANNSFIIILRQYRNNTSGRWSLHCRK